MQRISFLLNDNQLKGQNRCGRQSQTKQSIKNTRGNRRSYMRRLSRFILFSAKKDSSLHFLRDNGIILCRLWRGQSVSFSAWRQSLRRIPIQSAFDNSTALFGILLTESIYILRIWQRYTSPSQYPSQMGRYYSAYNNCSLLGVQKSAICPIFLSCSYRYIEKRLQIASVFHFVILLRKRHCRHLFYPYRTFFCASSYLPYRHRRPRRHPHQGPHRLHQRAWS